MVFTVSPLDAPSCDQQGNIIPKREPRIEERKVSLPLRKSPSIVFSWPEFVIKSQCSELMAPTKNLVQVRYTDTIRSVLWTLIKNKVESVPVYNDATRKYAGVVDMFDLVQYIASAAGNAVTRSDFFQVFKRQAFADAQVSKITHSGAKDQCVSVPESSPISGLFDLTVASNLPRVPVMNRQKILGMVSQSDIVQYLVQNKSNFSQLSAKAIKDLTIAGADNVYTIEENTPTVSAFVYMAEKGVKGLAVVNSEGQFVDAINSFDVEGLVHGDFFSDLRQPVLRYLSKSRILLGKNLVPVVCTPEDTLADMLSKMAQEKVCRVFVIGADRKPTSVISLRDILKLMYTFIPDAPSISAGSGCQ